LPAQQYVQASDAIQSMLYVQGTWTGYELPEPISVECAAEVGRSKWKLLLETFLQTFEGMAIAMDSYYGFFTHSHLKHG